MRVLLFIITCLWFIRPDSLVSQNKAVIHSLSRSEYEIGSKEGIRVSKQAATTSNASINNTGFTGLQAFPLDFDEVPYTKDSTLNIFEIGYIPDQTVQAGGLLHFYVKADSLPTNSVKYFDISYSPAPIGPVIFNASQQYFRFEPDVNDTLTFYVDFRAIAGTDTVKQHVKVKVYDTAIIDRYSFGVGTTQQLPPVDDKGFMVFSEIKSTSAYFNGVANRTTYKYSISAPEITFEDTPGNVLKTLSDRQDIQELNLYVERFFVGGTFNLPQTNLNIYCKEIIFLDSFNGERSMIITTPVKPASGVTLPGNNAGDIRLFAEKLIDNQGGIRFVLIGGDGQNSVNSVSGEAGDGGNLISNLDIGIKGDYLGGLAGTPSGSGTYPIKYKGSRGDFYRDTIQRRWLHPNYIRQVLNYCDNAYFIGRGPEMTDKLLWYEANLNELENSAEFSLLPPEVRTDLIQVHIDVITLANRVLSGLDYYGNPLGWVPMLSFEFTQSAFEKEIDHASKILYLTAFVNATSNDLQELYDGYIELRNDIKAQTDDLRSQLDHLIQSKTPYLELKIAENEARLDSLLEQIKLVALEIEVRAKVKYDDQIAAEIAEKERNNTFWIDLAGTVGKVLTLIPEPICQGIGTGLTVGSQLFKSVQKIDNFDTKGILQIADAGASAIQTYKETFESNLKAAKVNWKNIQSGWSSFSSIFEGTSNIDSLLNVVKKSEKVYKFLNGTIDNLDQVLEDNLRVQDADLKKIKSELFATDPKVAALNEAVKNQTEKHKELVDELASVNEQIEMLSSEISSNAISFDNINGKITNSSLELDHRTVQQINQLKANVLRRLKQYHYYMARAYEFRTLKPYTGNLNIQLMVDKVEDLLNNPNQSASLSQADYDAISALYKEQISQIAEDTYKEYVNTSPPQRLNNRTFKLPADLLARLNNGEDVPINLVNLGVFNDNDENIRIAGLRVSYIRDSVSSNFVAGSSPEIRLSFTYPSTSRVKYKGKVYFFNSYNSNTTNPIKWATSYDKLSGQLNQLVPSPAVQSLLTSLLTDEGINYNNDKLFMYSQPSADAELIFNAQFVNQGFGAQGRMYIDSVLFQIDYDFNTVPSEISYLNVSAVPNWIVPIYKVSKSDINVMKDGQDEMIRVYAKGTLNKVTVQTDSVIGGYRFERWLDKNENPVMDADSTDIERLFVMGATQTMKAKYVWAGPVMRLPDTLYFSNVIPENYLKIKNTGHGDMKWVVDTIQSTDWVKTENNIQEGTGSFDLKLITDVDASVDEKTGYIVVIAPDAENAIDTTWLVYRRVPGCPSFGAPPPNVVVVNNTCNSSCTSIPGSISAPASGACPPGSKLQYQVNGGQWSYNIPAYNENQSLSIKTRCLCNTDAVNTSPESPVVITQPVICQFPNITLASIDNSGLFSDDGIICKGASVNIVAGGGSSYSWSNGSTSSSINVAPLGNTTYSVTVSGSGGCTATKSVSITVNSVPVVSLTTIENSGTIANDGAICLGNGATLVINGTGSYLWSSGETTSQISVVPLSSTTYTATVTAGNGCTSSVSVALAVSQLPAISLVTGGGSFCTGSEPGVPINLSTSQLGTGYQLLNNSVNYGIPLSGTGGTVTFNDVNILGTYSVVATNNLSGCTSQMSGTVTVTPYPCSAAIVTECTCKNNATTTSDGQFVDVIRVNAPGNQTWSVDAAYRFYTEQSPAPPQSPIEIPAGTQMAKVGPNDFEIRGIHIDDFGYSLYMTNGRGTYLLVTNLCRYPEPAILTNLNGPYYPTSNPIRLIGLPGDFSLVDTFFTVNGSPSTHFNPGLGIGQYDICYYVDGGAPKSTGQTDPGCLQKVCGVINVGTTDVNEISNSRYELLQNRPNPFSQMTIIGFVLPESCDVTLQVVDVTGRVIQEKNGWYESGGNEAILMLENIPSGVYFYTLNSRFGLLKKSMMVVVD